MKKKVFSKSMAWLLSVAMALGVLVLQTTVSVSAVNSSTGGFSKNYTVTGDGFTDMVNIAMAQNEKTQSQIGYNGSWCAAFVSDCAVLAGQESAIPWNGAVSSMYNAVINAGGYSISSPQAGDLVFFSSGSGYGHVGIVLDNSRNISGNIWYNGQAPSKVKILYNKNEGYSSWTFVRPNYKNNIHVHVYDEYVYNSSAHPHYKCYRCSCGDVQENRNEPTYVDTCPECHVHNYTEYVYNWAAHPHYKCYRCSCGDVKENRNEPTYVETCPDCIASSRVDIGTDFYAYIINTYPWKMVSVNIDNDNNVELESETALSNQLWYFERQDDLYYIITNVKTNCFLDDGNYGNTNGTNVGTWNRNGVSAQKWAIVECNGGYTLHPQCALEMALDVYGGYSDDGTNIQIWNTHNGAAQIFTIYRYGNLPDRPELTLRGNVFEGENVTVSWNACCFAHHYQIGIWHNGKEEQSFTSQNLSYTFENLSAGDYGICVTAVNQNGSSNVATYDFTVPNYTISPAATGNYSGHTYEYYDTKLTWNQAYKFCEKKGGHLVTINSQGENDFVVDLAKDCSYIWTGGKTSDKTTWYWITGEPFDYQNWSEGEPNDTNGNEDSLEIYLSSENRSQWKME